jgi:predicted dehydrogenase
VSEVGDPLNVAMIGVGGFGWRRRQLMRQTGLFRIARAYDLNPKALEAARRDDGAEPAASYEDLLTTPGIEAVVISTGAKFHAEQALAAMARGLHVFVEKPLCATAAEIEALVAAQRRSGVVVGVGHNDCTRDAHLQKMKEAIEAGELGTIATFEKTTAHSGGLQIKPGDWRGDPEKNPGGMLFQCGVHALHDLLYLFGPVASVACTMRYDVHTTKTADVAHCILTFATELTGTLNAYHVTPYRHTFSIYGTKGALHKRDRYFDEGTTLVFQPYRGNEKEPEIPVTVDTREDDGAGNLRSFFAAVRNGTPCYPALADGARAVAVVFAAEASARSGRAESVMEVGG